MVGAVKPSVSDYLDYLRFSFHRCGLSTLTTTTTTTTDTSTAGVIPTHPPLLPLRHQKDLPPRLPLLLPRCFQLQHYYPHHHQQQNQHQGQQRRPTPNLLTPTRNHRALRRESFGSPAPPAGSPPWTRARRTRTTQHPPFDRSVAFLVGAAPGLPWSQEQRARV